MSGICGILSYDGRPSLAALDGMMRAMQRHGPDGGGCWHDASVALGHQMMHTTPESLEECLPLHHDASRVALTSDARLDNREDLMRELGVTPADRVPDSELILKAYQRWGNTCVERLVGEFAFVVWDAGARTLLCFTDPMGVRPLFYREAPGKYFAFASEVAPLLAIGDGCNSLNHTRLAMLGISLLSVYLMPEETCFENIFRVPAASVLSVSAMGKARREYWKPNAQERLNFRTDAECGEAFRSVLFDAVKARLRSAFPVASLLSGGLDSSSIVAAASRLATEPDRRLITLSAVATRNARGKVRDEQSYIDQFRGHDGLEMFDVSAPGRGPFDDLEKLVETASLCSYSFQHFLYSALVRSARSSGARVILDGDGGELAASGEVRGYMAELLLTGRWNLLRREWRAATTAEHRAVSVIRQQLIRPLLPYAALRMLRRHRRPGNLLPYPLRPDYVRDVLGPDAGRIEERVYRLSIERPDHRRNMVHDLLLERRDLRQRSHAGFVDYQHAAFSYPFMDKRVLEFGLAVDGRFKYLDGQARRLLRLGMQGLLPERIRARTSKFPFSPDYNLRYVQQKNRAFDLLRDLSTSERARTIVDFGRVFEALRTTPDYRSENPMRVHADSQFTVPTALFLCYFLERFPP